VVVAALAGTARAAALPLREVARVPLSGSAVRFDYTSIDPATRTLWIAHMNADQLLAFDLTQRRIRKTIAAPGVHGVIAVPQLHRVYASVTNASQAFTIDARTGVVLARAPAGRYPDGLAYATRERRIYVSDESGGVEAVLNAKGRRIATVQLGGSAGNVQYDGVTGHVLVDVQSRDEVAVISTRTNHVIRRVHVPGCDNDHGLLVDAPHRIAFVACDGNATLHTLDLRTMRFTGSFKVGADPDVLAFDPGLRRLYVSSESGVVSVFRETRRSVRPLGSAFLAAAAHTVAVDAKTHLVYFPLERGSRGRPQLLIMRPTP
jgi:DNA-binding beta-propeller fold protein YncE